MRPTSLTVESHTSPLLPLTIKRYTSHQTWEQQGLCPPPTHRDPSVIKTFPLPWNYGSAARCCVVEVGDHWRVNKKGCYLAFQCTAGSSRQPLIGPRLRKNKVPCGEMDKDEWSQELCFSHLSNTVTLRSHMVRSATFIGTDNDCVKYLTLHSCLREAVLKE